MLIYRIGAPECKQCEYIIDCNCQCHVKDLVNGKHYLIKIEEGDYKVKPVKDLEHFRNV